MSAWCGSCWPENGLLESSPVVLKWREEYSGTNPITMAGLILMLTIFTAGVPWLKHQPGWPLCCERHGLFSAMWNILQWLAVDGICAGVVCVWTVRLKELI